MTVTYTDVISFFFFLYCLMGTSFATLVKKIPVIGDVGNWRFLMLVFAFIVCVFYSINKFNFRKYTRTCNRWYSAYVIIFLLCMCVLSVWSMNTYGQSIFDVLIASEGQYYVLLLPAFMYVYFRTDNLSKLFQILNYLLILILLLYGFATLLYMTTGSNIFGVSIRFGHLRLDPPFFAGILLVYNLWNYLLNHSKGSLVIALLYIIYLILMSGTRMEMIASVAAVIMTILVTKKGLGWQSLLVFALGVGIAIANSMGIFDLILESFSETSLTFGVSTRVRMEALGYFSSFQLEHPFVGMGYVRGGINSAWDYILYGPYGKYVFSDVGLIGFFYKTGFLSLLIVGIPLARIIYLFCKMCNLKLRNYRNYILPLLAGIIAYIAICQISLSITDVQRSMLLPFVWSLFEYSHFKSTNNISVFE